MFHVKICGVRRTEDVAHAQLSGADAIGLNFFPRSVRFVEPLSTQASQLAAEAASRGLATIGVFVDASPDLVAQWCEATKIDVIQIHGDESAVVVRAIQALTRLPVIRAIKLPTGPLGVELIDRRVAPWLELGCHPLLDADAGTAHGGSGRALDWQAIGLWAARNPGVAWTLAGGLTPENVADAIEKTCAHSVDAASGVEQPRGVKSQSQIAAFLAACQRAGLHGQRL